MERGEASGGGVTERVNGGVFVADCAYGRGNSIGEWNKREVCKAKPMPGRMYCEQHHREAMERIVRRREEKKPA